MLENYDLSLVAASYVVAVFAAYTALYFGARLTDASGNERTIWLGVGALAMGTGVWTMHFVGMRASPMMAEMTYGAGLTAISWVAALIASGIALHLIGRDELKMRTLLIASVAMGAGIVAMHYLGMYAMNMSLPPVFDVVWLSISVLIALGASGAALAICRWVRQEQGSKAVVLQFVSALVMAAAICGMHYTGMLGMFYSEAASPAADNLLHGDYLGLPLAVLCITLLSVAIFVTGMDINSRRIARIQQEEEAKWVTSAAFQDASTGLANRSGLEQQVLEAIASETGPDSFALIYLDIANYREMSVSQGAKTVEKTVCFIADKIKDCLSEGVLLSRYSNSSFMVLVPTPQNDDHQFMFRRLRQLENLETGGGQPVLWRAGQSLYPDSGHSSRRLIRAAMVNQSLSVVGSFDNLAQDPNLIRTGS
ncbi:MHYT domain-containing protein [Marinobacter sp. CHS3-4]|uniref:MHYT domain-containing protein n=1 Tax=Marinobacter sp. CHS3-4 TaxID=3045174 RepID=UPI0024B4FC53|nr:MHYT domain-containing protein [Marinobacter sp. CHS3-4]MDI9243663.1 MHYT domain-containing protein [Marinobacter sp. CHS3-4]